MKNKKKLILFIAVFLLIIGISCLIIKGMCGSYLDEKGVLHEPFFLLPVGFFFIFSSFITFALFGINNIVLCIKNKK